MAVALGSPWGLEQTVTSGVVERRRSPGCKHQFRPGLIQTDASINPGNSGGALADRQGRVIGVNIEIFTETGTNSGVGFAVPINVAYGIAGRSLPALPSRPPTWASPAKTPRELRPVPMITEVVADGPAADAGLQVGDLVTAVDALGVRSMGRSGGRIRSYNPGDEAVLDVIRDGESFTLTVTLGVRPADG